jgi:hypothetical protein
VAVAVVVRGKVMKSVRFATAASVPPALYILRVKIGELTAVLLLSLWAKIFDVDCTA